MTISQEIADPRMKLDKGEKAMEVWDRLERDYPHSRYLKDIEDVRG